MLIRLCWCAGWSAPLLVAYCKNRFSHEWLICIYTKIFLHIDSHHVKLIAVYFVWLLRNNKFAWISMLVCVMPALTWLDIDGQLSTHQSVLPLVNVHSIHPSSNPGIWIYYSQTVMKRPIGQAVSASDFGSWGLGFISHRRQDSFRT